MKRHYLTSISALLAFLVVAAMVFTASTATLALQDPTQLPLETAASMTLTAAAPPRTDSRFVCLGYGRPLSQAIVNGDVPRPVNAIEVLIAYAPESDLYLPDAIRLFNRSGILLNGRPVHVSGIVASSGTVSSQLSQAISANQAFGINADGVLGSVDPQASQKLVIFQPSVRHWLSLVNHNTGQSVFDIKQSEATALAPLVIAIWKSRLDAIRKTLGYNDIGWEELLAVGQNPSGWAAYGIPNGGRVKYGHTDPFVSSVGLSTLIAEFQAAAVQAGRLAPDDLLNSEELVENPQVQGIVRKIEELIVHYSARTTEFKEYIAQGPSYVDFVALEENDLIFINQGLTQFRPPEPLVALYPKEGTFIHDHPMGILTGVPWITPEQKQAAAMFVDFILSPEIQRTIVSCGFRSANPNVPPEHPLTDPNSGIDLNEPQRVLEPPDPNVIAAIQQSWGLVKKQADIMVLVDISGSMNGVVQGTGKTKLQIAQDALMLFLQRVDPNTRVGISVFDSSVTLNLVPMKTMDAAQKERLGKAIEEDLDAGGRTNLYDAVTLATNDLNSQCDRTRICAILLMSDGKNEPAQGPQTQQYTLADVLQAIVNSGGTGSGVKVIPVAYGTESQKALPDLEKIAQASGVKVQDSTDAAKITDLLRILSQYF